MIFLGYQTGIKGYRFMCIPNNIIFIGATALFDKQLFPKCEKPSIPGLTDIPDILPAGQDDHDLEDPTTSNSNIPLEDNDDSLPPVEPSSPSMADHHELPYTPIEEENLSPQEPQLQLQPPTTQEQRTIQSPSDRPARDRRLLREQQYGPPRRSTQVSKQTYHPENVYGEIPPSRAYNMPD